MGRLRFRIMVAALTFAVGVAGVWLIGAGIPLLARVAPRSVFRPTWRGCGNGYGQAYQLPNGQKMAEGSESFATAEETQKEFESEIVRASRIIERVPGFKNRHGDVGERVVLLARDEVGQEHARILWYDGGRSYLWIDAPSLEIAHTFEEVDAYAY